MSAPKKTLTIGSVLKRKDDGSSYIKISQKVTLEEGEFVNVEDPRTLPDKHLS